MNDLIESISLQLILYPTKRANLLTSQQNPFHLKINGQDSLHLSSKAVTTYELCLGIGSGPYRPKLPQLLPCL